MNEHNLVVEADIQLFHTRTSAPSIHEPAERLVKHTTRVKHAASTNDTHAVRAAVDLVINNIGPNADAQMSQYPEEKQTNRPLPSRSHNCMASKLRSLIIPSQGLNGLVMLCAKPGTSISAEEPE